MGGKTRANRKQRKEAKKAGKVQPRSVISPAQKIQAPNSITQRLVGSNPEPDPKISQEAVVSNENVQETGKETTSAEKITDSVSNKAIPSGNVKSITAESETSESPADVTKKDESVDEPNGEQKTTDVYDKNVKPTPVTKKAASKEKPLSHQVTKNSEKTDVDELEKVSELESLKIDLNKSIHKKVEDTIKKMSTEIDDLSITIADQKAKLKTNDAYIRELESQLKEYEDMMAEFEENTIPRKTLEHRTKEYQEHIDDLEVELRERNKELNDIKFKYSSYGEDYEELIQSLTNKDEDIRRLNEKIHSLPNEATLERLQLKEELYDSLLEKCNRIEQEKNNIDKNYRLLLANSEELEISKRFVKMLQLQLQEVKEELDSNIKLYGSRVNNVFSSLTAIDDEKEDEIVSKNPRDLKELCNEFRAYMATRSGKGTPQLYYDEKIIRTFIAGFSSPSRMMILEGLSGTGKSSLPRAFQDFIDARTIVVPVQSSWKDRNDLLGFYNDFKKQYKETAFLKALYKACKDTEHIYCIVLDEINLSRIEYYFADLLSIMEEPDEKKRMLELISDVQNIVNEKGKMPELAKNGSLHISNNIWFIGTANKDDSTFTITDKVYDRSVVINFSNKGTKLDEYKETGIQFHMNSADFQEMLNVEFINDDEKTYNGMMEKLNEWVKVFDIAIGNRISNQLDRFVPVYVACGGTVPEAVDIVFSRKILRKLEGLYDEDTKKKLNGLMDAIQHKLGQPMPISIDQIKKMVSKI